MRTYELVFIVQPELDEEGLNALIERVQQIMTDNGGEIVKVEQMGRHRLAYAIRKHQEGDYVLIHANLEQVAIMELERGLGLSEDIIRHLLVRLDEVQQPEQA